MFATIVFAAFDHAFVYKGGPALVLVSVFTDPDSKLTKQMRTQVEIWT